MLQKAGGTFTLTADVNFGATYGILSQYYKTRTTGVASAGQFRLARADVVSWRNQAGDGNLDLSVNSSNALLFNGTALATSGNIVNADISAAAAIAFSKLANLTSAHILVGSAGNVATDVAVTGDIGITNAGVTSISSGVIVNADVNAAAAIAYSKLDLALGIVNGDVNASAAIAYSKLNLATSIVNADINASAAIAYSKLNLSASILNADVSASAAIAYSKLAALTFDRALISSGAGAVSVSAVTATQLGYLSTTTSDVQTQLNAKQGNLITTRGDIIYGNSSNIAARLALGSTGKVLTSDGTDLSWATPSAGFANPMTTAGDLILGGASGTPGRLAIGSNTFVLSSNGTTASWAAPAFVSPLAVTGDIIYSSSGSTAAKRAIGTEGMPLKVVSGVPNYAWGSIKVVSSADYTILDNDGYTHVYVTTAGSNRTITLPALANNQARKIRITKVDNGAGKVIIDGNGSETVNAELTFQCNYMNDTVEVVGASSTNWVGDVKEQFYGRYSSDTAGAIGTSITTQILEDVEVETRAIYNTGTGIGTIFRDGLYNFQYTIWTAPINNSGSQRLTSQICIDIAGTPVLYWGATKLGSGSSINQTCEGNITLRLLKNQTFCLRTLNSNAVNRDAVAAEDWMTVTSVDH